MLSVTPTKLADYLACPHKYNLKHVEKTVNFVSSSSSPALSFGISMHRALREIYDTKLQNLSFEQALTLLENYWDQCGYADEQQSEEYLLKGTRALTQYCEVYPEQGEETIGTEVYLSYIIKTSGLEVRLGCKADRLSVDANGILEVTDYKTSASGAVPTPEFLATDLPTFLYYALTRISHPEYKQIRVSFINILTLTKSSVLFDSAIVSSSKKRLLECLHNLNNSKFKPHPSESCAWCPFQDICPATGRIVEFDTIT